MRTTNGTEKQYKELAKDNLVLLQKYYIITDHMRNMYGDAFQPAQGSIFGDFEMQLIKNAEKIFIENMNIKSGTNENSTYNQSTLIEDIWSVIIENYKKPSDEFIKIVLDFLYKNKNVNV